MKFLLRKCSLLYFKNFTAKEEDILNAITTGKLWEDFGTDELLNQNLPKLLKRIKRFLPDVGGSHSQGWYTEQLYWIYLLRLCIFHFLFFNSSFILFLNQRSDGFYNFTLVLSSVCHELISETAPRISPKLGIKFGDNKGKKIADPFYEENSHLSLIWPKVPEKWPFWPKITFFVTPTNFPKLH